MKKVLLMLLFATLSLGINAQTVGYQGSIDEYDLQGGWKVNSFTGKIIQLDGTLDYFSLSGNANGSTTGLKNDQRIHCWFISNGNKLHWIMSDNTVVNFVITAYDKEEKKMTLKTFDDACTMECYQWNPVNGIQQVAADNNQDGKKYNLQGMEVTSPKGVYIENGVKKIAK